MIFSMVIPYSFLITLVRGDEDTRNGDVEYIDVQELDLNDIPRNMRRLTEGEGEEFFGCALYANEVAHWDRNMLRYCKEQQDDPYGFHSWFSERCWITCPHFLACQVLDSDSVTCENDSRCHWDADECVLKGCQHNYDPEACGRHGECKWGENWGTMTGRCMWRDEQPRVRPLTRREAREEGEK